MSHVLAFTLRMTGHLFPFVPILTELARRGHSVTLALAGDGAQPFLDGIQTVNVPWPVPEQRTDGAPAPRLAPFPPVDVFAQFGEMLAVGLHRVIARDRPSFVLLDPMLWGGMIACEASRTPWGTVAHNPLCFRGLGPDARGPALPPPTSWSAELRHRVVDAAMRLETRDHLAAVNLIRRTWRLAPLSQLSELLTRPPLILATTAEPFEYPRTDWPSTLRFVGPMIWDPPETRRASFDATDPRSLVLVTDSTATANAPSRGWTDKVLTALSEEPYHVVATVPADGAGTSERAPLAHSTLLPFTACVVCHGGPGIVHKALWFGVPVVCVPFAYDRYEVARRVETSGAGVTLPIERLTHAEITRAIRRAIALERGAQAIGHCFRSAGGPSAAADAIEQHME
ncbi:MAG: glycosyltransferase [Gemmatimonadaceae bacterium]